MLSYEKWKVISESLGGALPLGIKTPETIGVIGNNTEPLDFATELEEAKKCLKKKMDGDVPSDDGSEGPPLPLKKKGHADAEADAKGDHEEPDDDEDEEGNEPSDDAGSDAGSDAPENDGDDDDDDDGGDAKPTLFQKKKQKKNMKKEESEFFKSLLGQLGSGHVNQKFWDGLSEDAVYPPADPNVGLGDMQPEVPDNPQPGDVGYAPFSKLAGLGAEYEESTKSLLKTILEDSRVPEEVKKELRKHYK